MLDSDKNLEKKLLEAGKKLLDPLLHSSIENLLQLLDNLFICLSDVDQDPPDSMEDAMSPLMKELVAERLFKHLNVDVKVAVAACIVQIMRITAPHAPYDDEKMKEVLQLIVSSFEDLANIYSFSYGKRILILETVSKVRLCNVMLDLECNALLIEMFQHFLRAYKDIIAYVLEESEDIPPEMLSTILHYLKKDDEVPQISCRLAEQVLTKSASKLKTFLTKAVKSSGVSLDKYSDVVASICQGIFSGSKQDEVVAHQNEDKQKASELSTPEQTDASKYKTSKATLTKKSGKKVASSSKAKPTAPPTKKNTSETKATRQSEKKAVERSTVEKSSKSKELKKKPGPSGANKKPGVSTRKSVSKSKTEVKQPLEKTPNTENKRKHSLGKEKASGLQICNENLVGSRIRVWWPIDRTYYSGVVDSYDSAKKKHLICYDEGDQEILNLKTEKWDILDKSELSEEEEANQLGPDEEASTIPQKKKAKTGKAQSAKKKSKMLSSIPDYDKRNDEVIHEKEDRKGSREVTVKDKQKAAEVSTPEQTCVPVSSRRETVAEAGVKTLAKKTHEMAEEEDPTETETQTNKQARLESCSLHKAHGEMEKTAAGGEPSFRTPESSAEPEDLQQKKVSQPCSVTQQLAMVKQSIVDTITGVRQFRSELESKEQSIVDTITSVRQIRSELETKEQSIVDILTSVRQFQVDIKKKEDNLEASLQEVDVLGEKILGINKLLNS